MRTFKSPLEKTQATVGRFCAALCVLFVTGTARTLADPRCVACHPGEVAAYAQSSMAHSLSESAAVPAGSFQHDFSGTKFSILSDASGITQQYSRSGHSGSYPVAYVIGSGKHAYGFLVRISGHLFQSPLSYYSRAGIWDVAPGYEKTSDPDFTRPVTLECLLCHSGNPRILPDTLNTYAPAPFLEESIGCDRCHGAVESHLKNPVRATIVNPSRLAGAARDSVCEQCHLNGEIRIPNPGKTFADFRPGQRIEETYTIYVSHDSGNGQVKVVSHSEQLALSACARNSEGKLWCGTCHNPHDANPQTAAFFRLRCLTCHGASLEASHAAPGRDCVACHMPRLPARDGGHTAFTDHRIRRRPSEPAPPGPAGLVAWREPDPALRDRNLALALVAWAYLNQSQAEMTRGYQMLTSVEGQFPDDVDVLTSLGSVQLHIHQPTEALRRFQKVLVLRPNCASCQVNAASALIQLGNDSEAIRHLTRALELDPLFQPAVVTLSSLYRRQGQLAQAAEVSLRYQRAMSNSDHSQ